MDMVRVIEETQICPFPASPVSPKSLPCTFFDLLFLDTPPIQFLFFYRSPQPKTILPDLKHSLSLALKHYYPLAGNLKWPQRSTKPELTYNEGDSVSLTVAESEFDLNQLSGTSAQQVDLFVPLYARLRDVVTCCSGEKLFPLIAFQITFFGEKGICIGITFSHIVSDGNTIFSFIKAWASLHSSGVSSVKDLSLPLPFYDRSAILKGLEKNETALLKLLKESAVRYDTFHTVINSGRGFPKGVVHAAFIMSPSRIQTLKHHVAAAETQRQPTRGLYLSSFSVTCAYTWVCFIKARWGRRSDDATQHLIFPVDIRACLDSPVPLMYFGNCGASVEVKAKTSELLGEQGIAMAAKRIGNCIQNVDVYGELEKDPSYYASLPPQQILGVGSFPKFGAYQVDFGWGRPNKFQSTIFQGDDVACMFLNDSPNNDGGIEIGFVSNAAEVDAFASAFANSVESHGLRSMM